METFPPRWPRIWPGLTALGSLPRLPHPPSASSGSSQDKPCSGDRGGRAGAGAEPSQKFLSPDSWSKECWTPASQCAGNRNLNKMALQSFFFDCVYLFHVESIKNPCISSRERSQTDKMVDGMDFEELCSDFECISSPYVESIMRQVARDIFELREDNRAFSCYAVPVKYEAPS
ncbi:uncharacterized protein [Zea mays]|nr:uncharacterized protein LOC100274490 isoform X3 [Zea mays]|eukprot:XP_008663260.1 uncharacterized protein LOC100274490 isoform X3 [Zea mays]